MAHLPDRGQAATPTDGAGRMADGNPHGQSVHDWATSGWVASPAVDTAATSARERDMGERRDARGGEWRPAGGGAAAAGSRPGGYVAHRRCRAGWQMAIRMENLSMRTTAGWVASPAVDTAATSARGRDTGERRAAGEAPAGSRPSG